MNIFKWIRRQFKRPKNRIVLAMLSPPDQGGIIAQAMAIQAHQPSIVVLIHVSLNERPRLHDGTKYIEAWSKGSSSLMAQYPDLDEPFPFPITSPHGYVSNNGGAPTFVHVDCTPENIPGALKSLIDDYEGDELRFDFLPGGKFLKVPLLLDNQLSVLSVNYTLEDGDYIQFTTDGEERNQGRYLSIIDRCWISGYPVHIEGKWPKDKEWRIFYSDILRCLEVEPMGEYERTRLRAKKISLTPSYFKARKINRPIGFNSDKTIHRLRENGFDIEDNRPENVKIVNSDGLEWNVELRINGVISGMPLEFLMLNELSSGWNFQEILHGISMIERTASARVERYRTLLGRWKDEYHEILKKYGEVPDRIEKAHQYMRICELHGLDYDISLDDLMDAEISRMQAARSDEELMAWLAFMRICEIDAMTLDEFGISSFDCKGAKGPGWDRRGESQNQQAMQRPDFLRPTPYFAICSTNPPENFSQHNVLHISRLHQGRKSLFDPHRYRWDPFHKDTLLLDWQQAVDELILTSDLDSSHLVETICHERLYQSWPKIRDMFFHGMSMREALLHSIEDVETSELWLEYELRVKEAQEIERKRKEAELREIADQILAINPDIETEGLGKTKLKTLLKQQIKAQKEAEKEEKEVKEIENIREKLRKKDPELELDNLSSEELRKLSKPNKRRRNRARRDGDTNYPCPHPNCKTVCNAEKQLEEHMEKKHPKQEE